MISNKKKLLALLLSGAMVFSAAGFFGYNVYASNLSKQVVLDQKKADFDKQYAELLASNDNSEQGKTVKDLGTEIGQLEKEINPKKPGDILAENLSS